MELHELRCPAGSRRPRKRRGRGPASGVGGTAGRGHKGQKARSGASIRVGFEGGQMPLSRRIPKRGFTSPRSRRFSIVNISVLNRFPDGTEVTPEMLLKEGIVGKLKDGLKILGSGKLGKRLVIWAHRFSGKARSAIESAGGSCHQIVNDERMTKSE